MPSILLESFCELAHRQLDLDQDWLIRPCPSFSSAPSLLQPGKCFYPQAQGWAFFLPTLFFLLADLVLAGSPQKKKWTTRQKSVSSMSPGWGRWGQFSPILIPVLIEWPASSFLSVHQSSVGDGSGRHRSQEHQVGAALDSRLISRKDCGSLWIQQIDKLLSFLSTNTHKLPVWLEVFFSRSSQMEKIHLNSRSCNIKHVSPYT